MTIQITEPQNGATIVGGTVRIKGTKGPPIEVRVDNVAVGFTEAPVTPEAAAVGEEAAAAAANPYHIAVGPIAAGTHEIKVKGAGGKEASLSITIT